MWEPLLGDGPDREARMAAFVADTPMRRFGTVDEVASIALLLASDEAAYMTGTELTVDGGLLAGSAAAPRQGNLIAHGDAPRNDRRTEDMTELVLNPGLVRQIRLAGLFLSCHYRCRIGCRAGLAWPLDRPRRFPGHGDRHPCARASFAWPSPPTSSWRFATRGWPYCST